MTTEGYEMLNFHPVDKSEPTQHQVVTATGESSILYGNESKPIVVDDDSDDAHFSEDDDFPAKKVCFQSRSESGKNIIKPAKFKPAEIDVTRGNSTETPEHDLVSLKQKKKQHSDEVEIIDVEDENTFEKLNVQLRVDAWQQAVIKNGKTKKGVRADELLLPNCFTPFGLVEDNFRDYNHLNSRVYDDYLKGFVVLGTKNAVCNLLNATSDLKIGTHGVIVDTCLPPSYDGLYEEGECLQYQVIKELGKGSFGTVSFCSHHGGQKYVKKVISEKFSRKEVEVLMQLSHPNITAFRGYIFREGKHEIMMEYGGDSLKTLMEKNRVNYQEILTYEVVTKLSLQGFSALEYMYERFGILHLDIKPENICVQLDPATLKFTDFGTSKTPQQAVSFDGWTPEYMSPEACRLLLAPKLGNLPDNFVEDLTGKADVFAFGLAICFMLTGNHTVCRLWPKHFTPEFTFSHWRSQYICHLAMNPNFTQAVAIQDDWPREMRDLLTSSLEGSPSMRITASEACHFIKQHMLTHQVNIPILLSPASPCDQSASDLPTAESNFSYQPPSPLDVSLQTNRQAGGGKDIKNQLRRKIRRKSAAPYQRQLSVAAPVRTETADHNAGALPVFAALGMDSSD